MRKQAAQASSQLLLDEALEAELVQMKMLGEALEAELPKSIQVHLRAWVTRLLDVEKPRVSEKLPLRPLLEAPWEPQQLASGILQAKE